MIRAPEVFLPPWTPNCTGIFFFCSLTLGVKVVALANRRKSIAYRLQLFRRFHHQKSVQYDQPLTVRAHLAPRYMKHERGCAALQDGRQSRSYMAARNMPSRWRGVVVWRCTPPTSGRGAALSTGRW